MTSSKRPTVRLKALNGYSVNPSHRLAVRRAPTHVEVGRVHHQFQIAPDNLIVSNLAVMHEHPTLERKGMAIASLDGAEGRRTDMGKEKGRFNLTGNADEVMVIPG